MTRSSWAWWMGGGLAVLLAVALKLVHYGSRRRGYEDGHREGFWMGRASAGFHDRPKG